MPEPALRSSAAPAALPRRRWLGSVVAIAGVALLAAAAWYLTHRAPVAGPDGRAPGASSAARGAAAGPGGPGGGGGRGAPASTVGVA
ncbi:MAG: efflux RND transporter periplasmic adaptor subunit, partial [Betaproteobacteria bacterium]